MPGLSAVYISATSFRVTGDYTTVFVEGRRVRAYCGTDGYKYATVSSSSYSSPNTTVTLKSGGDSLTSNLSEVWVGIIGKGTTHSMPEHTHAGEATGGYLPSLRLGSSSGGLLEDNQTSPSGTRPLGYNGYFYATRVYNAVWNDIADFQPAEGAILYGRCYRLFGNGVKLCNKKAQKGVCGIASDTFGFGVGKNDGCIPIAVCGWVLAYVDKEYECGTPLINDENAILTKANWFYRIFFHDRIIAIYDRKETRSHIVHANESVEVRGRHWVKVI